MELKDYFFTQDSFEIKEIAPGILKTFPIPQDLTKYYESKDYISHHQDDHSLKTFVYKFIQRLNLKLKKSIIKKNVPTSGTILDYGCGVGDFLLFIEKEYTVFGLEPNETAQRIAQKKVGREKIKNSFDEVEDSSLDAITLWHVFEHIEEQEIFLNNAYSKLKPKGKLIIAIPNYKSYDAQYYKNFWAAYDVPRHIFHFSKLGMQHMFNTKKWKLQSVRGLPFDAFYISMLSEKYKKNPLFIIKGSFVGLISNFKALKTKDYSSLVYVVEKL